jgi:hypothetical protein
MTPTCSKAAMRVLISILLASSVANAAALPHQVVDARAPAPIQNAELAAQAIQAAASAAAENPTNFFEDVSEELNNRTGYELFRDFFIHLFGPRYDDDQDSAQVTVTVTASAEVAVTIAEPTSTSTLEIILPPIASTTSIPENEIIFSILPIGNLTALINATVPTPVFTTPAETGIPAAPTSVVEIVPPFPVLNATAVESILPTAAIITGEFSVTIPLVTDIPSPVNSTAPEGTGIALPFSGNVTDLLANATAVANSSTTVVVVTETVIPVPIVTGTVPSASAGLPIIIETSPLWPNGTYGQPTILPIPVGTAIPLGTGIILATGTTALPVVPVVPVETVLPLSTGFVLATGTGSPAVPTDMINPLYPNTTSATPVVLPIPILVTGVPEPVLINLTMPEPNATISYSTAVTNFTQIPILVTGTPNGVLINVTLSPPAEETAAAPLNATLAAPTVEIASLTELPITVTGVPGAVLNVSVTIPSGPFTNVSATAAVEVSADVTAAVSVGTGLPIASLVDAAAPFTNASTTATATEVVAATPEVVVPQPGTLHFLFPGVGNGDYQA